MLEALECKATQAKGVKEGVLEFRKAAAAWVGQEEGKVTFEQVKKEEGVGKLVSKLATKALASRRYELGV